MESIAFLIFGGIFWIGIKMIELGYWTFDSKEESVRRDAERELVATDEEELAVKRKFVMGKTRMAAFEEIKEELTYIFGEKWRAWADLDNDWYILDREFTNGHDFKKFQNVCYSLMLAKWGKYSKVLASGVTDHVVCDLMEGESMDVIKKICVTAEKWVSQKRPDSAYDAEMYIYPSSYSHFRIAPRVGRKIHSGGRRLKL